jgi:glutamate/tyrosine decarboxylase-like PLP-dependent enzyme
LKQFDKQIGVAVLRAYKLPISEWRIATTAEVTYSIYYFIKAAAYFKMKLILVPVDEKTRKCNLRAMRRAITKNTVLVSIYTR